MYLNAAARGDFGGVKRFLDAGGDVNFVDPQGGTAIGLAAMTGQVKMVEFLVENDADINLLNGEGNNPLVGAALFGEIETTRALLDAGADPSHRNFKGETPADIASIPWMPMLEQFIGSISDMLQIETDMDEVRKNRPKVARILREAEEKNGAGNAPPPPGDDIWTAARTGDVERLKVLLDHDQNPSALDMMQITPLSWAAINGQVEAMRLLLDAGVDPSQTGGDNNTALHAASFMGQADAALLLLSSGANTTIRNTSGEQPLDTALLPWTDENAGAVQFIGGMLQVPVDLEKVRTGRERIANDLAPKYMRKRGADRDIWQAAKNGRTEELRIFLNNGDDPDQVDFMGMSPLAWAAINGQVKAARILIEAGADVRRRFDDGGTIMHFSGFLGQREAVRLLIDAGADVNARNDKGETPLDSVSFPWSDQLQGIMGWVSNTFEMKLDTNRIRKAWPELQKDIRNAGGLTGPELD